VRRLSACVALLASLLLGALPARAEGSASFQPKDTVEANDNGM
jgi:hypothetical protein